MKNSLSILAAAVMLASVPALASGSSFGVTVNLGLPLPVAPAPVMVLPSVPVVSLVMGVPYDLVYYGNRYYARQEARWYCSDRSYGPWQPITWRYLPERLRHPYEPIREVRTVPHGDYDRDGRFYREGQYRRAAWQHDFREGYEVSRIERGRDFDRHDRDERR